MGDYHLELTIIRASGLPDVQKWKLGTIQDPYATIKYGDFDFRTKTHNNGGTAPAWSETFSFPVGANPVISLAVVHDRVLVNDEIIGTGSLDFSKAQEAGELVESVPLFTTDGKQQGVLECKLKFPTISARLQMTRQMSTSVIDDPAKSVYDQKLAAALRMRQKKAAQILETHETIIEGSIASLPNSEPFEEHERALEKTTTAYLASTESPIQQLEEDLEFHDKEFLQQLMKEIDSSEDFKLEIERYATEVGEQDQKRRSNISAAHEKFTKAVKKVQEELLQDLQAAQQEFELGVEVAAGEYKKEAKTLIFWQEEAKAKKDVAAYEVLLSSSSVRMQ
ncbi:hypothetical protein CLOM_g23761 [Closterium sp. NIES-68]|nr:hypothetical protein CLOM_g23761 [Closterium sp. NIES-68]GJP70788.1 hypothetical protein CLOP_g1691 [Closterium sp. NIES-67]